MRLLEIINKTFKFKVGNFDIAPTYWQAAAIVFLLFLLVWTLARLRHMYVSWSLKGLGPSIFFGFLLALIFEGFLILSGKTLLTELLGWENAPKPISTALDEGRSKLVDVLGETTDINGGLIMSQAPGAASVINDYQSLSPTQAKKAKLEICGTVSF